MTWAIPSLRSENSENRNPPDLDYLRLKVSTKGAQLVPLRSQSPSKVKQPWQLWQPWQTWQLECHVNSSTVKRSCYCCTYSSFRHTCVVNCFRCLKGVTFGLYWIFIKVLNDQQLNVFDQKELSSLNTTFFQS